MIYVLNFSLSVALMHCKFQVCTKFVGSTFGSLHSLRVWKFKTPSCAKYPEKTEFQGAVGTLTDCPSSVLLVYPGNDWLVEKHLGSV